MKNSILKCLLFVGIVQINYGSYSQDFEVSPVKIKFNAEPGQTQVQTVNIFNHSNEKTTYYLTLADFVIDKFGKKIAAPAGSTESSLTNWISILPPRVDLNPNEEGKSIISMQAPSGDYSTKWAYINVRTVKEQTSLMADKDIKTGMIINGQIIISVIQSPNSNNNYKLKISNLAENPSKDSIRAFSAIVNNIGEKIANCKITLIASNLTTANEIILDELFIESYPGSDISIKLLMKQTLPPGKYALAAILDYGSKNNLEGTQMLLEVQ